MSKRKRIGITILLVVIITTACLLILSLTYQAGRDKGRSETVELIDQLASEYRFTRIEDEEGWVLGSAGGGNFFPNYDGTTLMHSYDWDNCKIHLSYEK